MYRKETNGFSKHFDFVLLDLVCLQLAFFVTFVVLGRGYSPYRQLVYRNMAILIELVDVIVLFANDTLKSVLKRGSFEEFKMTCKHVIYTALTCIAVMFVLKNTQSYSRMVFGVTFVTYFFLTYLVRIGWKGHLIKKMEDEGARSLLVVTNKDNAENVIKSIRDNNFARYHLSGLVILDEDMTGQEISGIRVVASVEEAPTYVTQHWVDEVFVIPQEKEDYPQEVIDQFMETGVTVHINLAKTTNVPGKKQIVEKVANYTVLTTSMNYATTTQLVIKRAIDILGGLVGCIITGILCIFIAPAIYFASPGPIFFAQERVGKNGKRFKMYKFRSMYMDAEARKAELMKQNKVSDAKMFKMDFDPRVIGNKILPDGTHKKGIGQFIRDTSIDEFPQFFNVLKGDMSIVGTRPPVVGEVNLYELRHRARLAIKPGITGMWQVSGRSDITDFEKVVELDKQYINEWNIGLDIKILFKTVLVVFKKDGSM